MEAGSPRGQRQSLSFTNGRPRHHNPTRGNSRMSTVTREEFEQFKRILLMELAEIECDLLVISKALEDRGMIEPLPDEPTEIHKELVQKMYSHLEKVMDPLAPARRRVEAMKRAIGGKPQ